jgi:hypothetical protein
MLGSTVANTALSDSGLSTIFSSYGIVAIVLIIAYALPIILLGFVFYYFTGQNRKGTGLMNNLMRVSLRFYNYFWMFVSAIVSFVALNQFLIYVVNPPYIYYADKTNYAAINGLVMLGISLVVLFIHFLLNYFIQNKFERKGTVITKIFISFGVFIYSLILFGSSIGFFIGIFTGSTTNGAAFIHMFLSFLYWLGYIVYGISVYSNEKRA